MSTKKNNKRGITRRDFIKLSAAAGAAGTAVDLLATGGTAVASPSEAMPHIHTNCPYCSVGCGQTIVTDGTVLNPVGTKAVDIYGDPDHVISRGAHCSKGAASYQLVESNQRIGVPNGKRPSAACLTDGPWVKTGAVWADITWDAAMTAIAADLVAARNSNAGIPMAGTTVNGSAAGIAFLGCSHMTNEENYIYRKLISNLGTNNIEHQARI